MGLFNKAETTSTESNVVPTKVNDVSTSKNTPDTVKSSSSDSFNFLDVFSGIIGGNSTSSVGSNRTNTGSGDPISSIVSSISNVASAWIGGDANKQVAKLNVEADKLLAEAEASKADQELYKTLKAQAETKTNEATQLANKTKSNNITNWLIVLSVLALAFGIIFLVFKAVFGWTSSRKSTQVTPVN